MSITYSSDIATTDFRGKVESFRYHVMRRGPDYVVIHTDTQIDKNRDRRITFVDGGTGYWIDIGALGLGMRERFDRIQNRRP